MGRVGACIAASVRHFCCCWGRPSCHESKQSPSQDSTEEVKQEYLKTAAVIDVISLPIVTEDSNKRACELPAPRSHESVDNTDTNEASQSRSEQLVHQKPELVAPVPISPVPSDSESESHTQLCGAIGSGRRRNELATDAQSPQDTYADEQLFHKAVSSAASVERVEGSSFGLRPSSETERSTERGELTASKREEEAESNRATSSVVSDFQSLPLELQEGILRIALEHDLAWNRAWLTPETRQSCRLVCKAWLDVCKRLTSTVTIDVDSIQHYNARQDVYPGGNYHGFHVLFQIRNTVLVRVFTRGRKHSGSLTKQFRDLGGQLCTLEKWFETRHEAIKIHAKTSGRCYTDWASDSAPNDNENLSVEAQGIRVLFSSWGRRHEKGLALCFQGCCKKHEDVCGQCTSAGLSSNWSISGISSADRYS